MLEWSTGPDGSGYGQGKKRRWPALCFGDGTSRVAQERLATWLRVVELPTVAELRWKMAQWRNENERPRACMRVHALMA